MLLSWARRLKTLRHARARARRWRRITELQQLLNLSVREATMFWVLERHGASSIDAVQAAVEALLSPSEAMEVLDNLRIRRLIEVTPGEYGPRYRRRVQVI